MVYYDPLITAVERQLLQEHHQIQVLSANERGMRKSDSNKKTLFFMPHCPKGLYENVLFANWGNLEEIGIIGNSLITYVERQQQSKSNTTKSCLELVLPFLQEHLIGYSKKDVRDMPGQFEAAFNDTYLTWLDSSSSKEWPERPIEPSSDGQNEVL